MAIWAPPKSTAYRVNPELGIVYGQRGRPIKKRTAVGYIQLQRVDGCAVMAHRVIWESVHGPIPPGMQINHKNGVKSDNRIDNLEIVTGSENMRHAFSTGLHDARGERNGRALLTAEQVRTIRESSHSSKHLAGIYGVSQGSIQDVRARRSWRHL